MLLDQTMGLRGSLRGWSCSCLRRSHRGRVSGKDPGCGFFSKGVNFIGIHKETHEVFEKIFSAETLPTWIERDRIQNKRGLSDP